MPPSITASFVECAEMFSSIPTDASTAQCDDPPALMKGSVIPVSGRSERFTPTLIIPWNPSHAPTPEATRSPKRSEDWRAIINARATSVPELKKLLERAQSNPDLSYSVRYALNRIEQDPSSQ